ncbi:MAG: hypothetical protein Kow00111_20450 [Thermincola ferriacetica]
MEGFSATWELGAANPGRSGSVPELDGSYSISQKLGRLPSGYSAYVACRR